MKRSIITSLLIGNLFVSFLQSQTLTFSNQTSSSNVGASGTSFGAAWGDFNNDGFVDLYVTKRNGEENHLYQNQGPGGWSFVDVASSRDVNDAIGSGHGVAFGDYDNDGHLDIYVGNHSKNLLYTNQGPTNYDFIDDANDTGVQDANRDAAGIAWADYNGDAYLDIYVGNHRHPQTQINALFRSNGSATFTDVASTAGVEDDGHTEAVTFGDYDNDGDLDLFSTNSGSQDFLYQNNGNGTFASQPIGASSGEQSNSRGAAFGDYDNDGDLDL